MSVTAALQKAPMLHEPPVGTELLRHYLRELVYGANDGIITTFAVVSGVAGASLDARTVLILGAANLLADGFSMGASNYLSIRSDEAVFEAAGRVKYTTVAVAEDGQLAGFTELIMSEHDPGRVFQWGTLVRPEHRGHRLGMATKAHNLRAVQQAYPGLSRVTTQNGETNSYMVSINETMGFVPVEVSAEFFKNL
mgnify:CR=1 FL=1